MQRKRTLVITGLFLFGIMAIICITMIGWCNQEQVQISKNVGVNAYSGRIVSSVDTHGGFLGDGEKITILHFSDKQCLKDIEKSLKWNAYPLPENLAAIIYGYKDELKGRIILPVVKNEEEAPIVPMVQRGYYCFINREENSSRSIDTIFIRPRNFTVAIYDLDSDIMYYIEYDS